MYNIAICDDDKFFMDYMEDLIRKNENLNNAEIIIYKYTSGEQLIEAGCKGIPYDLLILDMKLEKMDGDDTAKEFRKQYPDTLLVFCSGICMPTVKSFETEPFRYLIKKYNAKRMSLELDVIIQEMKRKHHKRSIALSYRNKTIFVEQQQILYASIRKYGSTVVLYDRGNDSVEEVVCSKSLDTLYKELDERCFAFPHKSYFVNLGYVQNMESAAIKLIDGTELSISKAKFEGFKTALAKYFATLN